MKVLKNKCFVMFEYVIQYKKAFIILQVNSNLKAMTTVDNMHEPGTFITYTRNYTLI